jgi:hypothetical protein
MDGYTDGYGWDRSILVYTQCPHCYILIWVTKNAEFDADFKSVKKVVKNSPEKSY